MNENKSDVLKASGPAALAEEYIVRSIWNKTYPAGSFLPAERELSDKIGVTRTTLREVLQRLARDGWLNIQHGKQTQINNIWETGSPSIAEKLIKLDKTTAPLIINDILSLRTRMSDFYIPEAIKRDPEGTLAVFDKLDELQDNAKAYTEFDYHIFKSLTVVANKPVYGLIFNSFKGLYNQIGEIYFSIPEGRKIALEFYQELYQICLEKEAEKISECIQAHREKSGVLWYKILGKIQTNKNQQ